ncbi:uncharacterized protein LY89DRAFT_128906 [Mollisia scopiformis]|uniref:Zn(2)-C6 fungal-type domain-containing protein n=1 Tax=Mollisia scopiformis TaxID=149040 RepID=A0A194X4T1_MOLSC|nr:uncharacterized protein LY89DRAFT_128906 [Mollisia scopiformis]KUJ15074.1 hypothetical protein LY89DRAFT_128906 [Mollisia scopiformis]
MQAIPVSIENERKNCWCCRARRKKCDGQTPECDTCGRLGIPCAGFGITRPDWMDGGTKQDEYCRHLKEAVKSIRRQGKKSATDSSFPLPSTECSKIEDISTAFSSMQTAIMSPPLSPLTEATETQYWLTPESILDLEWPGVSGWETNIAMDPSNLNIDNESFGSFELTWVRDSPYTEASLTGVKSSATPSFGPNQSSTDCADWFLIMRYLESTIELLFPIYCCPDLEEKAYLLSLCHRSSLVRHTIISLASFHAETGTGALRLKIPMPMKLQEQYRIASQMLERNLEVLLCGQNMVFDLVFRMGIEALISIVHMILLSVSSLTFSRKPKKQV